MRTFQQTNIFNYKNNKKQSQHQKFNDSIYKKKIQHYIFNLNNVIGKGFSSKVYKGINLKNGIIYLLGQNVAIKVIDSSKIRTKTYRQLLNNQIQSLKSLNHQKIIKCYDVFSTVNNTYIISQYCSQGDMGKMLKKIQKVSQAEAICYLDQIALGMYQMFKLSIIHRDLKPSNIFLKEKQIKIADLGFSTRINKLNQINCNVGTPLYMPPQSLLQNKYSFKSDIWALGIIAYELVEGKTPFYGCSQKQLINSILENKINFSIKISQEYKKLVQRCLKIDPQFRINIKQVILIIKYMNRPLFQDQIIQKQLIKIVPYVVQIKKINQNPNCQYPVFERTRKEKNRLNPQLYRNMTPQKNQLRVNRFKKKYQKESKNERQYSSKRYSLFPEWARPKFKSIDINQDQKNQKFYKQKQKSNKIIKVIYEKDQFQQQQDQKLSVSKKKKSKVQLILLSKINFCRFMFKTLKLIEVFPQVMKIDLKQKILYVLFKNIMITMNKLANIIYYKQNQYNIQNWNQFLGSQSFKNYKKVIQQYQNIFFNHFVKNNYLKKIQQKKHYNNFNDQFMDSTLKISSSFIKQTIKLILKDIYKYSTQQLLPPYLQNLIIGLDFIVSFIQLCKLLYNLKNQNDHFYFAKKSKIEYIASGVPVQIFRTHFQKIEQKLNMMGFVN